MMKIFNFVVSAAFGIAVISSQEAEDFTRPTPRLVVNNELVRDALIFRSENDIYIPIRAVSEMLGGEVHWNSNVTITYNDNVHFPETFLVGSVSYTSFEEIKNIFGGNLAYKENFNLFSVFSATSENYFDTSFIRHFATFYGYDEEDLWWLSRIIHAEARGESFEGMLAVGGVVMNRLDYPAYPNSVREVIFDTRNGVQFSPIRDGSINNSPSPLSILAAIEVLEGRRNAGYALFFKNPNISPTSWISNNRQYAFTIANHSFFN